MNHALSRRQFLRHQFAAALAVSALPSIIPASVLGQNGAVAPSGRVTLGCIGTGPQGRGDMGGFLAQPDVQVVAVCDVKQDQLELARKAVNDRYKNTACATYGDFRELLARKDIDAVLIATPDHWHVPVAIAAARAGKDMYVEKPMGLTVAEDQMLRKIVQQKRRVFQFGTQQRSSREFLRACELVRNGRIGQLKHINVWAPASKPGGSTTPVPVPDNINYDFWLGPAPATPYTVDKCTDEFGAKTWWYTYDYALGFIAGWGVHPLDIALWGHPAIFAGPFTVEGRAIFPKEGACNTAVAWDVDFKFADGVTMKYRGTPNGYNEKNAMNDLEPWRQKYGKIDGHGTAFEGTEGWVEVHRGGLLASPESLIQESGEGWRVRLMKSSHHARNFVDAVKNRSATICPVDEAVKADILCHVSDIATRLGRKLEWDPKGEKFLRDAEANRHLKFRPMRSPWGLA